MEPKLLRKFEKLSAEQLPLRGGRVLIEILPKEEIKTSGGLIIATLDENHRTFTNQKRGDLAVVLAVGSGYVDNDGNPINIDLAVGNVVMIRHESLQYFSQFPGLVESPGDSLAMTTEGDIIASWPSMEAYNKYRETLNS